MGYMVGASIEIHLPVQSAISSARDSSAISQVRAVQGQPLPSVQWERKGLAYQQAVPATAGAARAPAESAAIATKSLEHC